MNKRIIGIDVARALAVIGMIIVNFKVVFGDTGASWVKSLAGIFDGKAAATFVFLAGVGLALMTNSAIKNNDRQKFRLAQKRITKRALFLFVVGVSYISIWPADILHFYGLYMLILLLVLRCSRNIILLLGLLLIAIYPLLILVWDYTTGWNFNTLIYTDFWTLNGFFRNLFFNGFHPVIPWTSFMLVGFWYGKQDLNNTAFVKKSFWISAITFIIIQCISYISIYALYSESLNNFEDLTTILGTNPMPPLPIYMCNGISIALAVTSACILIAKRFKNNTIIDALYKTGQLALTFYVAHVIIGMGIIEVIQPKKMGTASIEFSLIYSLIFSLLCVGFAVLWRKHKKSGPLEWLMRRLTD